MTALRNHIATDCVRGEQTPGQEHGHETHRPQQLNRSKKQKKIRFHQTQSGVSSRPLAKVCTLPLSVRTVQPLSCLLCQWICSTTVCKPGHYVLVIVLGV